MQNLIRISLRLHKQAGFAYLSIFDELNINRKILEHLMRIVQVSSMIDCSLGVLSHNTGTKPITTKKETVLYHWSPHIIHHTLIFKLFIHSPNLNQSFQIILIYHHLTQWSGVCVEKHETETFWVKKPLWHYMAPITPTYPINYI